MINGFAGTGVLFMKGNISNPFIGPYANGNFRRNRNYNRWFSML
ncbi:hypothetical protein Q5M85_19595 [Paraclostridium bifermentans]|nr:hypothetical protein [Paraclostridium bifermentans]